MKLYVIRHKKTGRLMPLASSNRGYTYWDPYDSESLVRMENVPRLLSLRAAKGAVAAWAKGETFWDFGKYDSPPVLRRGPARSADELEVIGPIRLQGPESWQVLAEDQALPTMLPR